MTVRQEVSAQRERRAAVASLLTGALIWGLIWYPYRILRDAGIDGVAASTASYAIALVLGLIIFRGSLARLTPSWTLLWLALASAGCNLGYVLATLSGEVMRVLLLFYLAPLWTVLLARVLLGERLNRPGACVIALSLAGAAAMLWQPAVGWPVPQNAADWFGLCAGFSFALFNVLSRYAKDISIENKSIVSFAGVVAVGATLLAVGVAPLPTATASPAWWLLALIGMVLLFVNLVVQYGLARVAANRAIVIMLSEIGFAALSSWLLAGELLGPREWLGGAMIVAASVLSAKMERVPEAGKA
jgi:drug/metabolite transporter (DMT)-like permease